MAGSSEQEIYFKVLDGEKWRTEPNGEIWRIDRSLPIGPDHLTEIKSLATKYTRKHESLVLHNSEMRRLSLETFLDDVTADKSYTVFLCTTREAIAIASRDDGGTQVNEAERRVNEVVDKRQRVRRPLQIPQAATTDGTSNTGQ